MSKSLLLYVISSMVLDSPLFLKYGYELVMIIIKITVIEIVIITTLFTVIYGVACAQSAY